MSSSCWDGVNSHPEFVASTIPDGIPVRWDQLTRSTICWRFDGQTLASLQGTTFIGCTPEPGDIRQVSNDAGPAQTFLVNDAAGLRACACRSQRAAAALSCYQQDPYRREYSHWFAPGAASVRWARLPVYRPRFERSPVRLKLWQGGQEVAFSKNPVGTIRSYDIGECDLRVPWTWLTDVLQDDQAGWMRDALRSRQIPEERAPQVNNLCTNSDVYSARVVLQAQPTLNWQDSSPTISGDAIGVRANYGYIHWTRAGTQVRRDGEVAMSFGLSMVPAGTSADDGSVVGWPRVGVPSARRVILGDSAIDNGTIAQFVPLGWQVAQLLGGMQLTNAPTNQPPVPNPGENSYDRAACFPQTWSTDQYGGPPAIGDRLAMLLNRAMTFPWRFHWPRAGSSGPQTQTCDREGAAPVYAFCNRQRQRTERPFDDRAPSFPGVNDQAPMMDCVDALDGVLRDQQNHPLVALLRANQLNAQDMVSTPGSGCYDLRTLPSWTQSEAEVMDQIQRNAAPGANQVGICVFRLPSVALNVMPDAISIVTTRAGDREDRSALVMRSISAARIALGISTDLGQETLGTPVVSPYGSRFRWMPTLECNRASDSNPAGVPADILAHGGGVSGIDPQAGSLDLAQRLPPANLGGVNNINQAWQPLAPPDPACTPTTGR